MGRAWTIGGSPQRTAGVVCHHPTCGSRDQLVPVGENAAFKGRGGDVLDGKRRHEFPLRLGSGQASIGKPKASSLKPKV